MTPLLCACAVVSTLEMQKCRKKAPHFVNLEEKFGLFVNFEFLTEMGS